MPYLALAAVVVAFCVLLYKLHADWQKERALLISRIQTPQIATTLVPTPEPPPASQTYDEADEYRALIHGPENGSQ